MADLFAPEETAVGYARVAVERGVDRYPDGLTYAVPDRLADLAVGDRVVVPLGRGESRTPGYVIEIEATPSLDPARIKPISDRDTSGTTLPAELMELARWISAYYCAPIGMTLAGMLPAAVKRGVGARSAVYVDLVEPEPEPEPAADGAKAPRLSPQRRAVLETLANLPAGERPIEIRRLRELAGLKTTAPIKALITAGRLRTSIRTSVEASWAEQATDATAPDRPTEDQRAIVESIDAALDGGFSTHLIEGVTGSGKTEVYIRLLEHVIARGRMGLVLVPEISLTPQTGGRLIGRFPAHRVAVLHSALTAAQRHQQWSMVAGGAADIVIGARSAVFAPIPDGRLGMVVVDEEHDGSYKQDQVPRYHGRDVAIRRGQLAGCPVVLGSATPSLESWCNATRLGRSHLHRLRERAPGLRLPRVQVVDAAEQRRLRRDRRVHLLGPVLEQATIETLDAGGQVLLLLNRRGYANYISCPDQNCGWLQQCDHCDVTVVYHKQRDLPRGGFVRCHHCQTEQLLPAVCPQCGRRVTTFGLGTQRVEEEICRKIPALEEGKTLVRVDSDTMRRAQDYHRTLSRFGDGSIRMLVGTQMIAKGLDFPNVRLVGVINADTSLNLPDFRATERTFQLVSQVAGRAGRGEHPGRVIVQTFQPDTPAIALAARHEYERFAELELAERTQAGLPPATRMTRIVLRDEDHLRAGEAAARLAHDLRTIADDSVRIDDPAPCPIARIAGRYRFQVELTARGAAEMQRFLSTARDRGLVASGAAMAVDVDPIALL